MNRSQIRTEIRSQAGDQSSILFTDAVLNQWIDLSTDQIISRLNFDTAMATVTSVTDEPNYQFASGQHDLKSLFVTASDGKEYRIPVVSQEEMDSLYGIAWRSDASGRPQIAYRADYNVVGLYPKFNSTESGRTIRFFFNREASNLSSDSASPIFLPQLHMANVHWSVHQAFLSVQDFSAAKEHLQLFEKYFKESWHNAQTFAEENWSWRWG